MSTLVLLIVAGCFLLLAIIAGLLQIFVDDERYYPWAMAFAAAAFVMVFPIMMKG